MCERARGRGWLISDNRRRWTIYRLGEGSSPSVASSSHEELSSRHNEGSSRHKEPNSRHDEGSSSHSSEADQDLIAIAAPFAWRKRLAPQELRDVILRLCAGRFLTPAELAHLLDRGVENLVRRHLTPLVNAGQLDLRFPQNPHHPDQAYTAAKAK